jgi:hypothetical protein
LAEHVKVRLFNGIAELPVRQVLRQTKHDGRAAKIFGEIDGQVHAFTDDALVGCIGWTEQVRRKFQDVVRSEGGRDPFIREFDPVTLDPGEGNLQSVAFGLDGTDTDGLAGFGWSGNNRIRGKVEGDDENVCIFDVEQIFVVLILGLVPQGPTYDQFAEKRGAEGLNAEHVRHSVRIPRAQVRVQRGKAIASLALPSFPRRSRSVPRKISH